jgi:hypothetical protein
VLRDVTSKSMTRNAMQSTSPQPFTACSGTCSCHFHLAPYSPTRLSCKCVS